MNNSTRRPAWKGRRKSIKQHKKEDARAKKLQQERSGHNLPYVLPVVRDTAIGRLKLNNK